MENGNCTFVARAMYKKREVSAVRDFPPGCGRFAPRIDLMPNVDASIIGPANLSDVADKSGEKLWDKSARTFEAEAQDSEFTETLGKTNDSSFKKENPVVSSSPVDGPTLKNYESEKVLLMESNALEENGLTNTAEAVKCDLSDMSKDLHKLGSSLEGKIVLFGCSKILSHYVNIKLIYNINNVSN